MKTLLLCLLYGVCLLIPNGGSAQVTVQESDPQNIIPASEDPNQPGIPDFEGSAMQKDILPKRIELRNKLMEEKRAEAASANSNTSATKIRRGKKIRRAVVPPVANPNQPGPTDEKKLIDERSRLLGELSASEDFKPDADPDQPGISQAERLARQKAIIMRRMELRTKMSAERQAKQRRVNEIAGLIHSTTATQAQVHEKIPGLLADLFQEVREIHGQVSQLSGAIMQVKKNQEGPRTPQLNAAPPAERPAPRTFKADIAILAGTKKINLLAHADQELAISAPFNVDLPEGIEGDPLIGRIAFTANLESHPGSQIVLVKYHVSLNQPTVQKTEIGTDGKKHVSGSAANEIESNGASSLKFGETKELVNGITLTLTPE